MTRLSWLGVLLSMLLFSGPAGAQDAAPAAQPDEWQAVISSQIQAFRDHDAPMALSFASATFQTGYSDPQKFFLTIVNAGYLPIVESRSESFGPYQMVAPDRVLQDVKLVGNDQSLHEAIYQLIKEPGGWRVGGVQLVKTPGVGV